MRDFEKISFEEFCKDVKEDKALYDSYKLPIRDSIYSSGYDIFLIEDVEIKPDEIIKIPTGIKAYFEQDEMLLLVVRSSTGFKYNIRLVNQVGIIDSDYYNNGDNEGHIYLKIQNHGKETVKFEAGKAIVQACFTKYLTTKSDRVLGKKRKSDY